MASHQSKRLRVLSGRHAGACLELAPGEHTIGPAHDNDIAISDWTAPTLVLCMGDQGDVHVRGLESNAAQTQVPLGAPAQTDFANVLHELQPARFGDIVICLGPTEGVWPTDMELLARLFEPAHVCEPAHEPRPRRTAAYAASAGLVVAVASCLVAVMVQASPQESAHVHVPERGAVASESLRLAFNRLGIRGLQVRNEGGAISVDGMLETREQSRAALGAISELPMAAEIRPRFAVVEDVAESIRSSVGLPQAQIKHLGAGVFSFHADTVDPDATRAAVNRVAADLAPSVSRIDAVLEQTETAKRTISVLSSFSDGEVSVVQTRDGAKHFGITRADQSAISTK
jgi:type III secretion protein D